MARLLGSARSATWLRSASLVDRPSADRTLSGLSGSRGHDRRMPRVLLLLPSASYRAPDFLKAARAAGIDLVVGSDLRQAMAGAMGDRALVVPLADPDRAADVISDFDRRSHVDAVVAVDDQGTLAAAFASKRLGLAHNPPEAVAAARDKVAMRRLFAESAVPQPDFRVVERVGEAGRLASEVGFPCVVKPKALSASRGVIRSDDAHGAGRAESRVRSILRDAGEEEAGELLVEGFVPGPEVAVEALLHDGRLEVLAVFDKPDALDGPYFEETLYVTPSRVSPVRLEEIGRVCAQATEALGLLEGPVHAELRLGGQRAAVIELAARSIGGLCSRCLSFGAGMSLEQLILARATGTSANAPSRQTAASGVLMIPIERTGRLVSVEGLKAASAVPGVTGIEITATAGRTIRALPEGDRYLGFIFASGGAPSDVEQSLRRAHAELVVRIDN